VQCFELNREGFDGEASHAPHHPDGVWVDGVAVEGRSVLAQALAQDVGVLWAVQADGVAGCAVDPDPGAVECIGGQLVVGAEPVEQLLARGVADHDEGGLGRVRAVLEGGREVATEAHHKEWR